MIIDVLTTNLALKIQMSALGFGLSCSESWKKTLRKTTDEFEQYEDYVRRSDELGYGNNVIRGEFDSLMDVYHPPSFFLLLFLSF